MHANALSHDPINSLCVSGYVSQAARDLFENKKSFLAKAPNLTSIPLTSHLYVLVGAAGVEPATSAL